MKIHHKIIISLIAACAPFFGAANSACADDRSDETLQLFLKSYCIKCHGPEKQKADRRFDLLSAVDRGVERAEMLQEILDQLNLAAMPPEDETQPSEAELKKVVALLTSALAKAREEARENVGKVVMRRLNRVEYLNTIRDLFQLKMIDFDPTTTFPADDSTDGFDNVGEGLVTSDYLLRNYLEAARKVSDKAIRPGPKPEMINYQMGGNVGTDSRRTVLSGVSIDKEGRKEAGRMFIKFRQPLGLPTLDKKRGVPADGEYVIRFSAKAVRRKSRYKDEDLRYDSSEPMRLSISIDSRELGPTAHRMIGEYEIPDHKVIEIEHRVWLEKGFTFHVHWANGPNGSFKRILRKVLPKYNKDALYPIRNPPEMYVGSGPELHVQQLVIEGPFYDQWPPAGFARFFPDPPEQPDTSYLDESLMRVASAAFRRPVSSEEMEPYLNLSRKYLADQDDFWAAAKYGVRAILTSPNFLYLAETTPSDSKSRQVSDHELATRLSYFLWSSMPDDELRATADQAVLSDPKVLRRQVERMLTDPKSSALTENFTGQWLGLRKLGEMPPDPEKNQAYYEDNLEDAMREETRLFFAYVLSENRSILEFVDSDYTFLNVALARHYGIPAERLSRKALAAGASGVDRAHDEPAASALPLTENDFRRVPLLPEDHRGGLLGHGSVLTATSNGVETQPVVRGIWVLTNLLGTPPSPPPPDVEPIEPDTRGVTTIRALMAQHRNNPTCYECHRKIDPIGLSMENFDYVGAWRDRYSKQLAIDSSGELPDGTTIPGPGGIKTFLLDRPEQFTQCLTEKLFVYALGRRLSFADRVDIDQIVFAMPKHNRGFRELIQQIVASEAFHIK
jgi:mono/diheme cytochrome c family protein